MIKSRNAFKLVMRYLVNAGLEPDYAFAICSAKTQDDLAEITIPHGLIAHEIAQLIAFANFTAGFSGFSLVDLVEASRKRKGA